MKKLASILCNNGGKEYRRNIYMNKGRLVCDGNDITPFPGKYPRGKAGHEAACLDIEAMYKGEEWKLEWAD